MFGMFMTEAGHMVWVANYETMEEAKRAQDSGEYPPIEEGECIMLIELRGFAQKMD